MADTSRPSRPDASVMNGVIPYIGYGGRANEAADFYVKAFGAACESCTSSAAARSSSAANVPSPSPRK
jgi:uncharacterized glyoxalase superfamily protein PhnB